MSSDPFSVDPRNQTFFIIGSANETDDAPLIPISLPAIDAQRVRLANTSINYGVQLGLCLFSLLTTLLLLPTRKLRLPVHLTQTLCLLVSTARLMLLVTYFPGPLTEYYVAWTRDASVLQPGDYYTSTASSILGVLQLALVEGALALQSWVLIRTWGVSGCSGAGARLRRSCPWRPPVLFLAVILAAAAVALRAVWVAHYTQALKGHTLPVPLDAVGQIAVVLGAASVFYFCGVFFAHLALHLATTRRVLRDSGRGRKMSITLTLSGGYGMNGKRRGLTSLEILAVGNGVLMLAPCLFAGLDIAAGPGNTRILPFDAGSWVQTLVAAGLPLISIAAFYRGSDSADSRVHRLRSAPSHRRRNRRASYGDAAAGMGLPSPSPFRLPGPYDHNHDQDPNAEEEDVDARTLKGSNESGNGSMNKGNRAAANPSAIREFENRGRESPAYVRSLDSDPEAAVGIQG
ncbi:fungal pheromone mating factor STE2 GPCR-domain-containing protein [Hypoxylon sp. NC1633]|nr:fungal pheromone mating factor STE2 GPCR-domain-containing protein [Hypoxylon sp. NC1633]